MILSIDYPSLSFDPLVVEGSNPWADRLRSKRTSPKADQLYSRLQKPYEIKPWDSGGHNPTFLLYDPETDSPFAFLKRSEPEFFSSFQQVIPDFPLQAPVWEREVIGFEQDLAFGFDLAPPLLHVTLEEGEGTVQSFIDDAWDGPTFYEQPLGGELLIGLSRDVVHLAAISGMLKGRGAGHQGNYLFSIEQDRWGRDKVKKLFEIDLEEILIPAHRISHLPHLNLCRLWILGLPQAAIPFDRDLLQTLASTALMEQLLNHHQSIKERGFRIEKEALDAQKERLTAIQKLCAAPDLTPRTLYFALFGGEEMWEAARKKGYPALVAFNNIISDPYKHIVNSFIDTDFPSCPFFEGDEDEWPLTLQNLKTIEESEIDPVL